MHSHCTYTWHEFSTGDRNVSLLCSYTFPTMSRRKTSSKSVAAVRTPAGPICVTKNVVAGDRQTVCGSWRVRSENDFQMHLLSPHSLPITFIVLWTVSNGRWQSTAAVVQRSAQFLNWIRKVRQRGKGVGFWTNLAAHKNNLPPHTPMGYI